MLRTVNGKTRNRGLPHPATAARPSWSTARTASAFARGAANRVSPRCGVSPRRSCAWWTRPGRGGLEERGKADQFEGVHREIVQGINDMLDAILLPIGEGNRILAQISSGKIDELIAQTYKGDHEKMKLAVNNVAVVVQGLQKELDAPDRRLLRRAALRARQAREFQGAYAEIVRGVNAMLDAILLPIGEGNRILAQISNGKIDELIAHTYKGDHEKMKLAVNNVGCGAGAAKGTDAPDRGLEGRAALRARQAREFPGRLRRDRARRQRHAGRDPAAHRRRQPHSGPDLQRQNRRADRPDLQGRPRKDEAGRQQRGRRGAGPAEGIGR
jgi:hypothetical protein